MTGERMVVGTYRFWNQTCTTRMSSPVSCDNCSRTCLAGFGLLLYAVFSVSNCLAVMVVRGRLFGWSPSNEPSMYRPIRWNQKLVVHSIANDAAFYFCYLSLWPFRSRACRPAFCLPSNRIRRQCSIGVSKWHMQNIASDKHCLGHGVPLASAECPNHMLNTLCRIV